MGAISWETHAIIFRNSVLYKSSFMLLICTIVDKLISYCHSQNFLNPKTNHNLLWPRHHLRKIIPVVPKTLEYYGILT